jgi:hypothetical protein
MSKDNGYYKKYKSSQVKLHQVKAQVNDLKKDIKEFRTDIAQRNQLIATLEGGTKINPLLLKPIIANETLFKNEQACIIALLSDVHGEHKITRAQTNNANQYNLEICEERLEHYFTNLLKLTRIFRKDIVINDLIWGWLGDFIHGFIHEEYVRTNLLSPIAASIWMTELLARGIKKVLEDGEFSRVVIICKVGNHSRITNKVYSDEEAVMSHEWGIYKTLAKMFPTIGWTIDESYFTYFNAYDKTLRFHHGHAFRYMGGIGGIQIPLMRFIAKVNRQQRADMDVIGHWHQRSFDATNGFLINGCVDGADPYSIRLGFPIEPPTQQFQLLDNNRGFTINAPIMLES